MSLDPIPIDVGEWMPDLPPLENPGAILARNCLPRAKSYGSINSLASFSDALASAALGAIWFQGSDNTVYNFAGTATTLERLTGGNSWSDVSIAGGYSGITHWEFAKFGDRAIAVAPGQVAQYYDTGVSTLFDNLPGSPPIATRIAVVRDFVVLGDLDAFGPNFIQWSGFNSSELWTPSRLTQADRQELFGRGGRVQRLVPGEYGVIFQEHSINRMDYTGPPVIFQLDEVERGRGTPAPDSVVWTGNLVFYYGHDGFYLFNGQNSEQIGANRVDTWFSVESDPTALATMRGVVDRQNRLVLWAFSTSSSNLFNNRIIIYSWATDRWSYAELDTELLAEFVSSGFTLDELDTPLPGGIDLDSINVDSDAFKGGVLGLQAFNPAHESANFSGPPLVADIDLAEYRAPGGKRIYTNSQRPLVDGNTSTVVQVATGTRNLQNENVTFSAPRPLNTIGEVNFRKDARYHRYRLNIAGGFRHAQGMEIYQRPSGGR